MSLVAYTGRTPTISPASEHLGRPNEVQRVAAAARTDLSRSQVRCEATAPLRRTLLLWDGLSFNALIRYALSTGKVDPPKRRIRGLIQQAAGQAADKSTVVSVG